MLLSTVQFRVQNTHVRAFAACIIKFIEIKHTGLLISLAYRRRDLYKPLINSIHKIDGIWDSLGHWEYNVHLRPHNTAPSSSFPRDGTRSQPLDASPLLLKDSHCKPLRFLALARGLATCRKWAWRVRCCYGYCRCDSDRCEVFQCKLHCIS